MVFYLAVFLDHRTKTTAAVGHDRSSTDSQTNENTETLVSDHDDPGNGDNMVSTKKSEVNGDIEHERLINVYERDVTISGSIDSRVHLTNVGLYGDSERTNKKLSNSLVQRTDEQDQVMTEIELDRIGDDSDQDTLLGGDGDKTHTSASRVRSRLMKMAKSLRSGFIKSLKDLKFFMRYCYSNVIHVAAVIKEPLIKCILIIDQVNPVFLLIQRTKK